MKSTETNLESQMYDDEEPKTILNVRNMAIGGTILLLAIGGGGAYYYFNHAKKTDDAVITSNNQAVSPASNNPPSGANGDKNAEGSNNSTVIPLKDTTVVANKVVENAPAPPIVEKELPKINPNAVLQKLPEDDDDLAESNQVHKADDSDKPKEELVNPTDPSPLFTNTEDQ